MDQAQAAHMFQCSCIDANLVWFHTHLFGSANETTPLLPLFARFSITIPFEVRFGSRPTRRQLHYECLLVALNITEDFANKLSGAKSNDFDILKPGHTCNPIRLSASVLSPLRLRDLRNKLPYAAPDVLFSDRPTTPPRLFTQLPTVASRNRTTASNTTSHESLDCGSVGQQFVSTAFEAVG